MDMREKLISSSSHYVTKLQVWTRLKAVNVSRKKYMYFPEVNKWSMIFVLNKETSFLHHKMMLKNSAKYSGTSI